MYGVWQEISVLTSAGEIRILFRLDQYFCSNLEFPILKNWKTLTLNWPCVISNAHEEVVFFFLTMVSILNLPSVLSLLIVGKSSSVGELFFSSSYSLTNIILFDGVKKLEEKWSQKINILIDKDNSPKRWCK